MYTLAVIIHVIVCFLMIASILLQAGKGAEIGAAFGGSFSFSGATMIDSEFARVSQREGYCHKGLPSKSRARG